MSISKRGRAKLHYAISDSCPDMRYAVGFSAPDAMLWFSTPALTGMVASPLEIGRAVACAAPGLAVLSFADARERWNIGTGKLTPERLIAGLAATLRIRAWQVPASFPLGLARRLEAEGLRIEPVAAFFPERRHKASEEIAAIRAGVALAETGLGRALDILRQSVPADNGELLWQGRVLTSETLRGEIDAEIARGGGSASQTIAAGGRQGADPHQAGSGPLRAGEPLVLDIFPKMNQTGYHGDLTRTVVKGRAPEIVQRAFATVLDAQRRAMAAVRPGVQGRSVHRIAERALAAGGFRTDLNASPPYGFIHGTGHGLGLEIHEAPRLSRRVHTRLACGDVVTVEPGLYDPQWGGVRLEDVVAVRPGGCDNLTSAPIFLEID